MMKSVNLYFALIYLLLPHIALSQNKVADVEVKENFWYKNSVIYNLEVGVFKDSDGDGRGDFNGLIQKLDYLRSLGIDAIWLAPFQPSPGMDDGYDVADYYGVDPRFGTSGDFSEFVFQARKRGIRVIIDLVINHTSDTHPWFQNSRSAKDSKYRDWYIWSKDKPRDWNKGMVFPGVQKEVWSLDDKTGEYYYHRFYKFQPDLNFANPKVMQESQRIIGYWLNQGISGFRLDAVPFIIEVPKTGSENPRLDFDFLSDMRQFAQSRMSDAAILGEANVMPDENKNYFGERGNGIQMMFNFYANQYLFYALATGDLKPFVKAIQETKTIPQASQWAHFLRNHDEIDLGRLTDKQRNEVYKKFGPDSTMQLYERGIRRRMAPMLGNNRKHLELAYSLLFSLPGTPVLRYGEELGMGDDLSLKERLSVRTPMQWTSDKNAGFTSADTAFRPVINNGEYGYQNINVARQHRDPSSLLNWMAGIIKLRKTCPEIGLGEYTLLETGSPDVFAIRYNYEGQSVIVVHNFNSKSVEASIPSGNASILYDLMTQSQDVKVDKNKFLLTLDGYGYKWYRADHIIP